MQGSSELDAAAAEPVADPVPPFVEVDRPAAERRRSEIPDGDASAGTTETGSAGAAPAIKNHPILGSPGTPDDPEIGLTLLTEAQTLCRSRRFADASRVLDSLERLRPNDPEVLSLIAITHAHLGRQRGRVRDALGRLSKEFGDRSVTWRAVGEVALARFQFEPAQKAARTSVHLAPKTAANWHSLAAAYAGNGWFDEAETCMAEATKLDPVGQYAATIEDPLGYGQWQIGRAVNYWALTRTYVAALALLAFVYFGLLGLAVALSTPMLVREVRIRMAPEPFRVMADLVWRAEHRLRLLNAALVSAVLIFWLALFTITQ